DAVCASLSTRTAPPRGSNASSRHRQRVGRRASANSWTSSSGSGTGRFGRRSTSGAANSGASRPSPRRRATRYCSRWSNGTRVPASAATATPGTAAASLRSGPTRAPAPPSLTSSAATTPTTPGVRSSRAWTYSAGSRARPPRGSATATRRTSTSTSPRGSRDSARRADPVSYGRKESGLVGAGRIRITGIRPGTLAEFKEVARDWKRLLENHGGRVLRFYFDETENKVTGIAEYESRERLAEIQRKCEAEPAYPDI